VHWGNIGSAVAGLAALIAASFAVIGTWKYGPAWLSDSRARQQAQTVEAEANASLAREQEKQIRLERRRTLHGWSAMSVNTYAVTLVTSAEEMTRARDELLSGRPTGYAIVRVGKNDGTPGADNQGLYLRQLVESEGFIARPPTPGEREALERGLEVLGIPTQRMAERPGQRRR
jgi:hypothetical protein